MQKNELPPMSGGSDDEHSHAHHRTEVICIEAKRICDFCFQEHRVERTFETNLDDEDKKMLIAECEIDEEGIRCRVVERRPVDKKKEKQLICLAIEVPVTIRIFRKGGKPVETIRERIVFLKQVVLTAPEGTKVDCQVTGDCCCFVDPDTGLISCVFNFCVVIQTQVVVRVLVPTFGPCQPVPCRVSPIGCPPEAPDCPVDC